MSEIEANISEAGLSPEETPEAPALEEQAPKESDNAPEAPELEEDNAEENQASESDEAEAQADALEGDQAEGEAETPAEPEEPALDPKDLKPGDKTKNRRMTFVAGAPKAKSKYAGKDKE